MTNVITGQDQQDPIGTGLRFDVMRTLIAAVVATLVAYFSLQQTTDARVAAIEAATREVKVRQEENFNEIQRALSRIESELVMLRAQRSGR